MKRLFLVVLVLCFPAFALAQGTVEERLKALEKGQKELTGIFEKYDAELYHTLKEKKEAGLASLIDGHLSLSGLLEFEASFESVESVSGDSDSASDLVLATAQLGLGASLNEQVSGDLVFLYEEDDTDLEIDEAVINLRSGPWSARLGQQYVPFGAFVSHFVSDPLTLELGETRETAGVLSYGQDKYSISAFLFNGDVEKASESEDHIRDWGLALTVTPYEGLEFGASYIFDLAEADVELLAGNNNEYSDRVAGYSAYAAVELDGFALSGEVLGAMDAFDDADLDEDNDGDGDQPFAWNLELAWYPEDNLEFAARLEGSDEFVDQPELQYGLVSSYGAWENVSLSLEYLHGEFDDDFGGGADSRELLTARLAIEF